MIKNSLTFLATITLAMGVIAGDDRDRGPVESLDAIAPNSETSVGNQNPKTLKLTVAGKSVSVSAHIACQDKLNLKESNIAIFRRAQAGGYLYNTGPIEKLGTKFSPDRWDAYFECIARNSG